MRNKPGIIVIIGLVVAVALVAYPRIKGGTDVSLDGFAACLADKGAVMYGSASCSYCQKERLAFGASFRLVPYVECPKNTQACIDKGVRGYPTWIFGDGRRLVGAQGIEKLSLESGCPLPDGR